MKKQEQQQKQPIFEFNENVVSFNGNIRLSDQYGEVLHQQPMNSLLYNYMVGMYRFLFKDDEILQTSTQENYIQTPCLKLGANRGILLGYDTRDVDFKTYKLDQVQNPTYLFDTGDVYFSYSGIGAQKMLSFGKRFTSSSNDNPPTFDEIALISQDQADNVFLLSHDKLPEPFSLYRNRALDVTITLETLDSEINKNLFIALGHAHTENSAFEMKDVNGNLLVEYRKFKIDAIEGQASFGLVVGSDTTANMQSLGNKWKYDDIRHGKVTLAIQNYAIAQGSGQRIAIKRTFTNDSQNLSIPINQIGLYAKHENVDKYVMFYRKILQNDPITVPPNSSVVITLNFLFPFGPAPSQEQFGTTYGGEGFTLIT